MAKQKVVPAKSDAPTPFLHDLPTAARLLNTPLFAVRRLCRSGELKYVAIGHAWLVSPEAIQAFIRVREGQSVEPTSIPRSTAVVPARLYRIEQAADYLGCTISYFETLYRDGSLKPVELSSKSGEKQKRTLFDVHDLDAYVEQKKKKQTEPE